MWLWPTHINYMKRDLGNPNFSSTTIVITVHSLNTPPQGMEKLLKGRVILRRGGIRLVWVFFLVWQM